MAFFNRVMFTPTAGGLGSFVVSLIVTGYRSPAQAGIPDGSIVSYTAESIDKSQWETGLGTYTSGTATLARTTLRDSSTGSFVSFTSPPRIWIDYHAQDALEVLTNNRTYFVRADGNNSNSGLIDSATGAFLTIQRAIDVITQRLDLGGFNVTVQVRSGTFTTPTNVGQLTGNGGLTIQGDTTTPANVIISTTSANCFGFANSGQVFLKGFKPQTTISGNCIDAGAGSIILVGEMDFGACAGVHEACGTDSVIFNFANYTISGGATTAHWHVSATGASLTAAGLTITLTGTPAFGSFFAGVAFGNITASSNTFVGAATGPKFLVHKNAVLDVGAGDLNYLPGNVAGTITAGGVYYGNPVIEGTAGQILFPSTQIPSANPNMFDDYEEGTWVPVDASGAALVFTGASGKYTKIGNLVVASGTFTYPATASGAGAKIGGLPFNFTAGEGQQGTLNYHNGTVAGKVLGNGAAATATFFTSTGGGVTNVQMTATICFVQFVYST